MPSSEKGYHHGNLRAELVSAALSMLDTHAASSLSLREVARRAGVSHNAPYHHFKGRSEMLGAAGAEAMRRFVGAQKDAMARAASPREALIEMGRAYVEWAVAHPGAFAVIYDPEICAPGNPSPEMAPLIQENEELLHHGVQAAFPEAGQAAAEALDAALWGTVHGLATLVVAGHLPVTSIRPALEAVMTQMSA